MEVTEGIFTHLRSTLRRLRKLVALSSIDKLADITPESLDERQAEIDSLARDIFRMTRSPKTKDYQACRLDKERLILFSNLSQQQSIEVLETHLHLTRVIESNQIHVRQSVQREIMLKTGEMEKHICEMALNQNRKVLRLTSRSLRIHHALRLPRHEKTLGISKGHDAGRAYKERAARDRKLRATYAHVFHAR